MELQYLLNKKKTMIKAYEKVFLTGKFILATFVMLALTACQEDVSLLSENGAVIGKGTLVISASSTSVNFIINNKAFTGSWKTTNAYDSEDEKRYQLMGSRSYEIYTMGNAPDQLRLARAQLVAQDGTEMTCDFYYRRQPRLGNCNMAGEPLKLVMQR